MQLGFKLYEHGAINEKQNPQRNSKKCKYHVTHDIGLFVCLN